MKRKFLLVLFTMMLAVVTILIAARHPTGPNTVSYDEPIGLWLSIGMVVVLFLPPLFLSLFQKRVVNIITAIYQGFVGFTFLSIIPIGFLFTDAIELSIVALIGVLVSIASIITFLKTTST